MPQADHFDRKISPSVGGLKMYRPFVGTLILLAVAAAGAPAQAKEEMLVTVRKAEEDLQDVPLAVTALPSATLESAVVQQLQDVAKLTPGLTMQDFNVGALATPVIRGLAQSNIQGRENNVALVESSVAQQLITLAESRTGAAPGSKPGRNDPCWCGSGVKYKKCHGAPGMIT